MKVLALIPARGGSKGIPNKNLADLGGIPLLAWSIRAAQEVKEIDRIVVSTDDEAIWQVAADWGVDTPFLRPKEISGDRATLAPTVDHTLSQLAKNGEHYDVLIMLYPTHPFRTPELISEVIEGCKTTALAVRVVSSFTTDISYWFGKNGEAWVPVSSYPSSELLNLYKPLGLVIGSSNRPDDIIELSGLEQYRKTVAHIKSGDQRFVYGTRFIKVDEPSALIDIDTPEDLEMAREIVASGKLNWWPKEVPVRRTQPASQVSQESSRRHESFKKELYAMRVDLNNKQAFGEEESFPGYKSLLPWQFRELVNEKTSFKNSPVVVYEGAGENQAALALCGENPKIELDYRQCLPVCSYTLYSQLDYAVCPLSKDLQVEYGLSSVVVEHPGQSVIPDGCIGSICGMTRVFRAESELIIELNEQPEPGDVVWLRFFDANDNEKVFCRDLKFENNQWKHCDSCSLYGYPQNLDASGEGQVLKAKPPPTSPIGSILWVRPTKCDQRIAILSKAFRLPGWIGHKRNVGHWVNEITGHDICGRQDVPLIYRWTGQAFLPAEVDKESRWAVVSQKSRVKQKR